MQQHRHVRALVTVQCGVMHLEQQREAVLRERVEGVEPVDQIQLPQGPRQVERACMDARGLDAELAPVAGLGQGDVAHVVLEIEAVVLDPVGRIQVERHAQQPVAEDRREVQPARDVLEQSLEAQPALRRFGRVVDQDQRDVGIGTRGVRIEEGRVIGAELTHSSASGTGAPSLDSSTAMHFPGLRLATGRGMLHRIRGLWSGGAVTNSGWILLAMAVLGSGSALLALLPGRHLGWGNVLWFLGALPVVELPALQGLASLLVVAACASGGALQTLPGQLGALLVPPGWLALAGVARRGAAAEAQLQAALQAGLGSDHVQRIPGAACRGVCRRSSVPRPTGRSPCAAARSSAIAASPMVRTLSSCSTSTGRAPPRPARRRCSCSSTAAAGSPAAATTRRCH
ncbi:MAG: hypothetical protein U1F11_04275 [Steroidobacteraceae bacterium]